jgi:hypothetical protein
MTNETPLTEQYDYGVVVSGRSSKTFFGVILRILPLVLHVRPSQVRPNRVYLKLQRHVTLTVTFCHALTSNTGRTVFRRLHLIGSCSTVLAEEAARLALIEAKKGSDVRNYQEAVALLKRVSRGKNLENLVDPLWATQQEKKNNAETARLENELKGYKNNLIKESIRVSEAAVMSHKTRTKTRNRWETKT